MLISRSSFSSSPTQLPLMRSGWLCGPFDGCSQATRADDAQTDAQAQRGRDMGDDAQNRLGPVQTDGAMTSVLAPPERKEPGCMSRCPMALMAEVIGWRCPSPRTPSAHPWVQCRSDEVMALAN